MAPVQGITDAPFRNAFMEIFGGVDTCFTPFVRWEHGAMRKKDLRDTNPQNNTVRSLVPQLIAASPDEAEALLAVLKDYGYSSVDVNLGCAFPVIAKRHKGCGLLPYPDEVEALMRIVDRHPDISFSVKMRLGYEDADECLRLSDTFNALPLHHVTVHARVGKQQYKGECDREAFRAFAETLRHPLVYNGDIRTLDDIEKLHREFPQLHGVMLGRGLLATPWLPSEYKTDTPLDGADRMLRMRKLHAALLDYYEQHLEGGEHQLLTRMKAFWEYLLADADRKALKKIHKAQRIAAYTDAVGQLLRPQTI